ncbi:MAG: elongation factor P [Chloroflexi bacterium]|nr:elongation factor P [Chloroflexota bacterium]
MIDVNDLRKGVTFEYDGSLYKVLDYSHNKPGRGNATIRTKIRNLRTGALIEKTFQSGDRVQDIRLDHHQAQYLYHDGDLFYFMDTETYDQPAISESLLGESAQYLKDGMEVKLTFYNGEAIDVELPVTVDLKVVEAEVAVRGDTANAVNKWVTTETGLRVQAPQFVKVDDVIRVKTESGEYLTRV